MTTVLWAAIAGFADEAAKEPVLTFDSDTFDFGDAVEGALVSHEYAFTNTGNALLKIEEVRPTCGCTIADDYSREVAPGARGKIAITFKTNGYDGQVTRSIVVRSNAQKKPETFITIKGNVKPLVSVSPKSLFLGNVDETTTVLRGTYTITNTSTEPLAITEVVPPNELTKAQLATVREGFEYRIDVTVAPPFRERQVTEFIRIKTNSGKMPELSVMYSYVATLAAKVNPLAIMLSDEALAKGAERDITVSCRTGYTMSLADVKSSDPRITFVLKETAKGHAFTLTVKIPAGFVLDNAKLPMISFRIKGVPNEQEYSVPIYKM